MRAAIAPDGHELGTYLRADELAHRFDVAVDDVLAACSILGFAAHDEASLIDVASFTEAVQHAPSVRPASPKQRPRVQVFALGAAAALVAVVAGFVAFGSDPSGPAADGPLRLSAARATRAAYQTNVKSTYAATVAELPRATDYRVLAQQLAKIEPPAEYAAEHAALIAEAEHVADLATVVGEDVSAALETTADALEDHVAELDGSPAP